MIQIYQNILVETQLSDINKILRQPRWGYGYTSTDANKPIWQFDKDYGKEIAELIASKLQGYKLVDWHINGQTRCMDGAPHVDSYTGCTHAFVFFPQKWDYLWGGRLHILPQDSSPVCITPIMNTGVLFDAEIPHYAEGVSYTEKWLRTTIGLKLNKI